MQIRSTLSPTGLGRIAGILALTSVIVGGLGEVAADRNKIVGNSEAEAEVEVAAEVEVEVAAEEQPSLFRPTVDDQHIRRHLQRELEKLGDAGGPGVFEEDPLEGISQSGEDIPKFEVEPVAEGDLIRRLREATVVLGETYKCKKCDNWHLSCAGGVIISEDGLALTNHHVIELEESTGATGARTYDGRVIPVVEVIAANEAHDVALIRLGGDGPFNPVPIAAIEPSALTDVVVMSHPDSHFFAATQGAVSRYAVQREGGAKSARWMEISADYAVGSSGCGVFNRAGEVVGLVAMTETLMTGGDGDANRTQMVVKKCVPLSAILRVLGPQE